MSNLITRKLWRWLSRKYPIFACEMDFYRRNRNFEPDLWQMSNFCSRTTNSIDVGVNMGVFARWLAKHSARVHGFECNPFLFKHLESFLPRNTTLHKCGLSDKAGNAKFRFDPLNTGIGTIEPGNRLDKSFNAGIGKIETIDVAIETLDSFSIPDVGFIKIDVEGHELEVLRGAHQLLKRSHPSLMIEIEDRHRPGNLKSVPEFLSWYGYRPAVLESGAFRFGCDLSEEAERGVNNFWFFLAKGEV